MVRVKYNSKYDVWASDDGFVYFTEPSVMNGKVLSTPSCGYTDDGLLYTTRHYKQVPIHRVVAECFCPLPDGYADSSSSFVVWHKNRDTKDNRADNLEFITRHEMRLRCPRTYLAKTKIKSINPVTAEEKVYECYNQAAKEGYKRVRILSAINKNVLYKGLEWHIISQETRLRNR